jgi:hypothetical protein
MLRQPDAATTRTVGDLTTMAAAQQDLARTMLPSVGRLARPAVGRRANAHALGVANQASAASRIQARPR